MNRNSSATTSAPGWQPSFKLAFVVLLVVTGALFFQCLLPGMAHFANDGPLGANYAGQSRYPDAFFGRWLTLNWVGGHGGSTSPNITNLFAAVVGPIGFAKFAAPFSILVLGLSAWLAFRQLCFSATTSLVGAIAVALNSGFFSFACWGLGTLSITIAAFFLALAAWGGDPAKRSWMRVVLAGFAIGLGIMEGFDNGAILSVFFAAYVLFRTWVEGSYRAGALGGGVARLAVVALMAGVFATHALYGLITTQIQGVAGMAQDEATRQQRWAEATQWSLPKAETLRLFVAGLYGYRLDTPDGGAYWGGVGRHPVWDEFLAQDSPALENAPDPSLARHSGSGFYCGVFVCLLALWTVLRSLWNRGDLFRSEERRLIWFWAGMAFVSLLLSWGKHAPLYALAYELPYFSTIRNPIKFLHPLNIAILVLFAYGIEGLLRAWQKSATAGDSIGARLANWWRAAAGIDRHWVIGVSVAIAVSLLLTLLYGSAKTEMTKYLMLVGYADANGGDSIAAAMFRHSIRELGWFIFFLAAGAVTIALLMSGALKRTGSLTVATVLLLAVTGLDLIRANLPWLSFYDYRARYASTPLYERLAREPWEGRAQHLPHGLWQHQLMALQTRMPRDQFGQLFQMADNLRQVYYGLWQQQQFQFYEIQSLDLVQEPRPAIENVEYRTAFPPGDPRAQIRMLRLTNGRYFLGPGAATLTVLNELLRPGEGEFRDVLPLWMAMEDGEIRPIIETNSPLSLIEFTGALPRAKLFAGWRVEPDREKTLATLRDATFDPAKLVLVEQDVPAPVTPDDADPGTVEITDYHPKFVRMKATVKTPSVLLFNDKHDPNWRVRVDGEPATMLRANFLMRGLHLEPGEHTIEWRFQPPVGGLYVSGAAIVAGLVLTALLVAQSRRKPGMPAK